MSSSGAESALALFRAGRVPEAEARLRALVAGGSTDADAIHLLGFILAASGRVAEGLPLLDRSIALAPRHPGFLDNRAQILMQMGLLEEAVADSRAAMAIEPRFAQGWLHLAQALRRLGRSHEALDAVGSALAIDAAHAGANYHAGLLRLEAGDFAAAEAHFARSLAREPRNASAHNNLGVVLRETGRHEAALESFARAVDCDGRNAEALNNLGLALHHAGRTGEALAAYARAVEMRPGFAEALLNRGNALRDAGDLEGARARYAEALAARADFPEALGNSASVALEMERLEEARGLYRRAQILRPDYADAQFGLAQIALREQRFAAGWDGYERRFDTDPPLATRRSMPMPRLAPENLASARRVAIWPEQGIGDQILFSTLLPELERRGIGAVVEVDARLAGLYRRSLPGFEFTTRAQSDRAFAGCDFHIPMGSLPALFRRDLERFSAQPRQLLAADQRRVADIRRQLGDGKFVAISWRSPQAGSRRALGDRKSIPLEEFARLAALAGARLVDLQYGDVAAERREFEARHPGVLRRIEGLDVYNDLEGLAAALVACGRLVTSSNATAHVAGALGVATQLAYLRAWAPFSYWVPGRDGRAPWYPSVRVATDAKWTQWEQAFEALGKSGE